MLTPNGRKGQARINLSTSGDNTVIAAPTSGHIEIDHISILPSGGAQTITFKSGTTTLFDFALDDQQGYTFDNTNDNPIEIAEASAFVVNISASTVATGEVVYRVVNEAL